MKEDILDEKDYDCMVNLQEPLIKAYANQGEIEKQSEMERKFSTQDILFDGAEQEELDGED